MLVAALVAASACDARAAWTDGPPGGGERLPGPVAQDVDYAEPVSAPAAPDLALALLDGTRVSLAELWAERPVVLVFFSSWCATCADQQRTLSDLTAAHGDAVTFLGIAGRDESDAVMDFLVDHEVPYPVAMDADHTAARHYAAEEPPLIAVIDRGGGLLRGFPGGVADAATAEELDATLTALYRRD
ncbi:Soluble secreted antigen MPT53 precursor [Actinoalloteichus hoggarensis]|uniref:Soluble secreted antigen MPT53 n=2 Tax=Actinoalloteichus hoggarensis TaxID=1470176 RepID=A0A221W2Z8_9PSEU|nr:Soluble secreted antigen MPT53 precursor [Actinoalloteichus hoggarensis]